MCGGLQLIMVTHVLVSPLPIITSPLLVHLQKHTPPRTRKPSEQERSWSGAVMHINIGFERFECLARLGQARDVFSLGLPP